MATDLRPDEIRFIREALDMTQEELASRVGVQFSAVSHWETGIRTPSGAAQILLQQLLVQAQARNEKKSGTRR